MSFWQRKTWQPPVAPQRISIDDLYTRPEVDGLKLAVPEPAAVTDIATAGLSEWLTASFLRTLQDISRL